LRDITLTSNLVTMDELSICGLSGRFPESENVKEFWENLIAGKDMVTEDDRRWKPGIGLRTVPNSEPRQWKKLQSLHLKLP